MFAGSFFEGGMGRDGEIGGFSGSQWISWMLQHWGSRCCNGYLPPLWTVASRRARRERRCGWGRAGMVPIRPWQRWWQLHCRWQMLLVNIHLSEYLLVTIYWRCQSIWRCQLQLIIHIIYTTCESGDFGHKHHLYLSYIPLFKSPSTQLALYLGSGQEAPWIHRSCHLARLDTSGCWNLGLCEQQGLKSYIYL